MALKMQVSTIEEVDEKYRDQYKEVTDGDKKVFRLDVDGVEDVGALKRAHERVKEERDAAIAEAKRKGEDLSNVEASFKSRIEAAEKAHSDALKTAQKTIKNEKRDKTVSEIVSELAVDVDSRDVLIPFVEKRIRIDLEDERAIPRVLDKDGKVSSLSIDDLKKELREDKRLARVVGASRGSGGGARPESRQVAGGQLSSDKPPTNAKELAQWIKSRAANRGA